MNDHSDDDAFDEVAEAAFNAAERLRIMAMQNTPGDFEGRKKAFIEYARAQRYAAEAQRRLDCMIKGE